MFRSRPAVNRSTSNLLTHLAFLILLSACGDQASQTESPPADAAESPAASMPRNTEGVNPLNNLYWGDTHLHTNLSADAFGMRNTTGTPDDAFMFAKGAPESSICPPGSRVMPQQSLIRAMGNSPSWTGAQPKRAAKASRIARIDLSPS